MRLAHLILAHTYPEQVGRLVNRLDHEQAHFYIHVDAKTAIEPFLPIAKKQQSFFIKNRVKVTWASYSMVEAILTAFKEILASGIQYDYINVISGQDYPIKSTEAIHRFFAANPGKLFMQFDSVQEEWQEAITRMTKYHFTDFNFPGKHLAEKIVNTIMPERSFPKEMVAMGRSVWFTITPESIAYILQYIKDNPWISQFFRLCWAPDELIFQTILYNSPFRKDMVNDNLLYVDWSKGEARPKVLGMEDAETIKCSRKLFARKFDAATDNKILDYVDTLIASDQSIDINTYQS